MIHAIQAQIEFTKVYENLASAEIQWIDVEKLLQTLDIPESVTLISPVHGLEVYASNMLRRVFFNLLDNSIRHGLHVTTITLSTHLSDDGLEILWEDNGVGIPPGEKEQIFEYGVGKNTGFGLFLIREILRITDITIQETGEIGKGARFVMKVPKEGWRFP